MAKKPLQQVEFHGDVALDFDAITFLVLSSILATQALLVGSIPILIGGIILAGYLVLCLRVKTGDAQDRRRQQQQQE